ncbi:hypothetical protein [Spirosoma sp.]|uniref:hypothetical protein n=1 Tax=Spirosoma sp. TaxID=1899569 RepID=UPI002603907E|nr:hypothetical protein [Spirosoma sp.]MCX6216529.1 hypothetical protein [Spirosoma sp.]
MTKETCTELIVKLEKLQTGVAMLNREAQLPLLGLVNNSLNLAKDIETHYLESQQTDTEAITIDLNLVNPFKLGLDDCPEPTPTKKVVLYQMDYWEIVEQEGEKEAYLRNLHGRRYPLKGAEFFPLSLARIEDTRFCQRELESIPMKDTSLNYSGIRAHALKLWSAIMKAEDQQQNLAKEILNFNAFINGVLIAIASVTTPKNATVDGIAVFASQVPA